MWAPQLAALALASGALLLDAGACSPADAADSHASDQGITEANHAKPNKGPFLKGQLHAHSWGSRDSDTAPELVVRWYSERGYDFVVLTDHNHLTQTAGTPTMTVLPGVEMTINLRTCEPPPPPYRHCLLHMNALIPDRPLEEDPWRPRGRTTRREDLYGAELEEVLRMGAIAQINHPNFHFAASSDLLVGLAARGLSLVEIANQAHDSMNEGDEAHVSTERMWDEALARGARIFGTATDDAHDYFESTDEAARFPQAYTGDHGFVMVRADRNAASIRDALARGDFYASTGVMLERADLAPERITLESASDRPVWFEIVGEGGGVYRAEAGRTISFDPREIASKYVRVRVTDVSGHHAWTQPVFAPKP